jgi:uncharacterized protein YqeY
MLLEIILKDCWDAKKAKDNKTSTLLSTLHAEAARIGKDSGNRMSTDEEVIVVIKKFVKNLKETIEHLVKVNYEQKSEAVDAKILDSENELFILNKYLPQQLTPEEIKTIIIELDNKNVGIIMKHFKENYSGRYDGKVVNEVIKGL